MSFELVDGACCVVRFAKSVTETQSYTTNYTLNINSTGAKDMHDVSGKIEGYLRSLSFRGPILFLYSASVYVVQTISYSYSDSN